jgi:hypothetical protein
VFLTIRLGSVVYIYPGQYHRGCRRRGGYVTLAPNIALFAKVGYCERIGVIDNGQGEIRAVLTNDVSSLHLSLGVCVACIGAGNHGYEHHGYDNGNEHYGNYRYHYGYYGHEHHKRADVGVAGTRPERGLC